MAFDADLTSPALIERFEPYFKHPDPDRYVLRMGDRAVACKNAKTALAKLGFARVFGNDPELYDSELAEAVGRKRSAPAVCDHPDFCPTLRAVCGRCCGAAAFRHLDETGPDDPDVYATPVTLALGIRAERCDRRGPAAAQNPLYRMLRDRLPSNRPAVSKTGSTSTVLLPVAADSVDMVNQETC